MDRAGDNRLLDQVFAPGIGPAVGRLVEPDALKAQLLAVAVTIERIQDGEGDAGEILGGGYGVQNHGLVLRQPGKKVRHDPIAAPNQEGMVPDIDHMLPGNGFDCDEVHHHPVIGLPCGVDHVARQRDFKRIAVAVQVTALALVVRDAVAGVEFEAAGNAHGRETRVCGKVVADARPGCRAL